MPLSALNSASDEGLPSLTADELTVFFASNRPGGAGDFDIYTATRSSPTGTFSAPVLLNGVNSASIESRPVLTADRLTLYAEVKRGTEPYHIERAIRTDAMASFGALAPVTALNSTGNDTAPFVMPDHSAIYLISNRGGASPDIHRAAGNGGAFDPPGLATGTNLQSGSTEDYPALTADELTIYFASNRPGGAGDSDIWTASRASLADGFAAPVPLAEINSAGGDFPGWISSDRCALYFSQRTATNPLDLFVARRPAL